MRILSCALSFCCLFSSASLLSDEPSPQGSLERLMKGNSRYVSDALEHPNRNQERREAIAAKQTPFATIVGCADSRVSPEIVFDQGVGDIFVVRVAGNVVGPLELDSVEYSVLHLHSSVVLVMGHENCGAVDAVIHGVTEDIEAVATLIEPAVKEAKNSSPTNLLEASVKTNARRMRDFLLQSPVIAKLVKEQKVAVHAAYYNLQTGAVELLKN